MTTKRSFKIIQPDQDTKSSSGLIPSIFEIRDIPMKGRGLVAKVDIPIGTRILCEKPIVLADSMSPDILETFLALKLKALPKATQRSFLFLHNNYPGKRPFSGIFRTNALPCGSGSDVGGIYPTICLINHSCLPNSQNNWNGEKEQETIHAIRPIPEGSEITISYGGEGPSAVRKFGLEKSFGFNCTCPLCSLPSSDLQASDDRQSKIQKLDLSIGSPMTMMTNPGRSLSDCQALLHILQEEYEGHAGVLNARLYYDAFQISIAHGDSVRGSAFAERAYQARLICEGDDSPETMRMKSLAMKPTSHSSFGAYSTRWKTKKGEAMAASDTMEYENWLFRK
ncbi:set domain-containing protein [Fusarium heterosporum]|uniref:Set domain-containing protein n=1 Tax=Fusarium heterosporum TaxID=42747 RepID=A0A8H5WU20_FUSHE|nr:set domain-containing protein [Fusarium heterosporum]